MSDLNPTNQTYVDEFRAKVAAGKGDSYMLTIARDGEFPVRSIYFYDNAIDASFGYSAYTDWGFAKDYLTVELHEPTGRIHSKVLRRPRGGECAFERSQYYEISEMLDATKAKLEEADFNSLIYGFAKLFSRDNQRFNPERFLETLGYTGEINDRPI